MASLMSVTVRLRGQYPTEGSTLVSPSFFLLSPIPVQIPVHSEVIDSAHVRTLTEPSLIAHQHYLQGDVSRFNPAFCFDQHGRDAEEDCLP